MHGLLTVTEGTQNSNMVIATQKSKIHAHIIKDLDLEVQVSKPTSSFQKLIQNYPNLKSRFNYPFHPTYQSMKYEPK